MPDCKDNVAFHFLELQRDGTVIYLKDDKHWEPPPVQNGWRRKNRDAKSPDAWILIPRFGPCIHRILKQGPRKMCGRVDIRILCQALGQLVVEGDRCETCAMRANDDTLQP